MSNLVVARAPTRIDLGGGWTDVPPYPERDGGFVCNIAISRYATTTVRRRTSANAGDASSVGSPPESELAWAALRRVYGMAAQEIEVHLRSDFPVGAGLGGSSAAGVATLGALLELRGDRLQRDEIAELSRAVEVQDLGIAGGRQDHYAAAYGGALALSFAATSTSVRKIGLGQRTAEELAQRSVLVYTGQSRISGETITAVRAAYIAGQRRVVTALGRMKELARDIASALERSSIDDMAALVGEHWMHQRVLHPGISTPLIDEIMERAGKNGAIGGKAMGASGGGCVLLFARPGAEELLRQAIGSLGTLLDFAVDSTGLLVEVASGEKRSGSPA